MIFTVLYFTLGICSLQLFPVLPGFICIMLLAGFGCLVLLLLIFLNWQSSVGLSSLDPVLRWNYWHWPQILRHSLAGILAFLLGFLLMWGQAQMQLNRSLPAVLENKPVLLQGKITRLPEYSETGVRFEFVVTQNVESWEKPGKLWLFWPDPKQALQIGENWALTVKLKRPRGFSNPGSFDKEKHFFRNRWVAEGVVLNKKGMQKLLNQDLSFVHRCRVAILENLKTNLAGKKNAEVITALMLGVTSGITQHQWKVFRETGTAHLMAISGLHVGFVGAFFYGLVSLIWRGLGCSFAIPAQWLAAWGGILGALAYALLAGFSVPTQRALMMLSLYFSSILLRRNTAIWRNYSIALGGVLITDPFASLMPGFWLSFTAVGVILYGMQGRLNPETLWWKWGRVQWVTFVGLMPLSIGFFQQFSWISPLANLIAIPWVTFLVVPLALMSALVLPLNETLAQGLQVFSEKTGSLLVLLLEYAAGLPKVSWAAEGSISFLTVCFALIGALILVGPRGLPGRWVGLVWCLPLFMAKTPNLAPGECRFTLLDVGQGLAAVVETQHHLLVFDTGPKKGGRDAGEQVLLPFLRLNGWKKIDSLIISHGDLDHIGGMETLLSALQVEKILASEPEKINFNKVVHCVAGKRWEWDGITFEMLHPTRFAAGKRNDHSCVLRVSADKQSVLLTGDIEAASELEIIERVKTLASTVLVVPHHGSHTSSTEAFIKAVRPRFALFPVGYYNPYGHPKLAVVQRYRAQGAALLDSVGSGAITFLLKNTAEVKNPVSYRQQSRKFWQADFKAY